MTKRTRNSWQDIHQEILRRIRSKEWAAGDLIPNESDLAIELGCARTTVNRALRAAAESGLLVRKRKAGTRVAAQPTHKAVLHIPVLRKEIEDRGHDYSWQLISRRTRIPTAAVRGQMNVSTTAKAIHLRTLHFADVSPFVFEDRWINLRAASDAADADFRKTNANEWLLANAPFSHGEVRFSAETAGTSMAKLLETSPSNALFTVRRQTWMNDQAITLVTLSYAPGYSMHISL